MPRREHFGSSDEEDEDDSFTSCNNSSKSGKKVCFSKNQPTSPPQCINKNCKKVKRNPICRKSGFWYLTKYAINDYDLSYYNVSSGTQDGCEKSLFCKPKLQRCNKYVRNSDYDASSGRQEGCRKPLLGQPKFQHCTKYAKNVYDVSGNDASSVRQNGCRKSRVCQLKMQHCTQYTNNENDLSDASSGRQPLAVQDVAHVTSFEVRKLLFLS